MCQLVDTICAGLGRPYMHYMATMTKSLKKLFAYFLIHAVRDVSYKIISNYIARMTKSLEKFFAYFFSKK